ncbi:MAG: hypothetical protein ACQESE_03555 [Nanobdellota archaeon]
MFRYKMSDSEPFEKTKEDKIQYWRFEKTTGDLYRITYEQAHHYQPTCSVIELQDKVRRLTSQLKEGYTTMVNEKDSTAKIATSSINDENAYYRNN